MRLRYLALALIFLTGGCVARPDLNTMQPHAEVDASPVYGPHTVGQTFVVREENFCGVELRWATPDHVQGPIIAHLRTTPEGDDIARVKLDPATQAGEGDLRVEFPPVKNSAGRTYYVLVEAPEATAQHPLHLRAAPRDVYAPGTAFADDQPWPGDLAFRASYAYDASFLWEDIQTASRWFWLLLPGLALFWAPGALLVRLWPATRHRFDAWERVSLTLGLSLSFIAFSLLWITQLGGRLNARTARLLYGILGVMALVTTVWRAWQQRRHIWDKITHPTPHRMRLLLLGVILAAGLGARLIAIRDLAFPAWVDSVHHTTLTRIILERGKVPTTYAPYVAVEQATYHFGFHAAVASFAWLSGLSAERAMLLVGQLLNAGMALQVYLLARWLTRQRWTAFFAAFLVALVSTMPAYYVTWGRYTQLCGLLVLPVTTLLTIEAVKARDRRGMALALFSQAGLTLIHYRVLAFYVCLVGAWWLVKLIEAPKTWQTWLKTLGLYAALGLGAGMTLLPWLAETAVHLWLRAWMHWGGNGNPSDALWDFSLNYAARGFDRYLLTVGILGALLSLWERRRFSGVLLLWLAALFIVTNPSVVGLPGEGLTNNIAMLITWFIPQAIWSGFILDELLHAWLDILNPQGRRIYWGLVTLIFVILGGAGLYRQMTILNPEGVLALKSDRASLRWIAAHLPSDSRFLINARPWQTSIYMGTDGGYWITPMTGRSTTTPPALYPLGAGEYVEEVQTLNEDVKALARSPEALARRLREANVDYVYIGSLGGWLDPQTLGYAPAFKEVYSDTYTYIYKVMRPRASLPADDRTQ